MELAAVLHCDAVAVRLQARHLIPLPPTHTPMCRAFLLAGWFFRMRAKTAVYALSCRAGSMCAFYS